MNPKLEQKLVKRFPRLFSEYDLPMTQTCMCWGCDCDDGWYSLIYETCERLEKLNDDTISFSQIKEKYGELRIYLNGGNDKAYDIVDEALEKSHTICEVCSAEGSMCSNGGWYKTLCKKHAKELCYYPCGTEE